MNPSLQVGSRVSWWDARGQLKHGKVREINVLTDSSQVVVIRVEDGQPSTVTLPSVRMTRGGAEKHDVKNWGYNVGFVHTADTGIRCRDGMSTNDGRRTSPLKFGKRATQYVRVDGDVRVNLWTYGMIVEGERLRLRLGRRAEEGLCRLWAGGIVLILPSVRPELSRATWKSQWRFGWKGACSFGGQPAPSTHLAILLPRVNRRQRSFSLDLFSSPALPWPAMIRYLLSSALHGAFSAVHLSMSACLAAISVLLSAFEDISSILFELASDLYGVPPRASFPTEKCAILILGAQEGVGRNAALSFSQMGYTVFALCPNRQERSGRSRDVASRLISPPKTPSHLKLLYTWHNRKERSRSIPWGLVAPMQLNLWSRSQREAVHQTVRAHCNTYDLHLVALVISHDSKSPRSTTLSFLNTSDTTERTDVTPDSDIDENAWRISVLDEVIEPVLMACDYKTLLAEASGRVIILSNSAKGSPLASLTLTSRKAAAESLAVVLESHGIRVSSIYFGPLAQDSTGLSPERPSVRSSIISSNDLPKDWQESLNALKQKISKKLTVQENLLLTVLRHVVQSRHPKFTYIIGVHPVIRLALGLAPVSARIAVKSLMRWAVSSEREA
ncbi:hypothetical protein BC826DRAFT_966114 [Russula brevipes]|nr:hypothetical protein BC826DRAFT_966114 [Russula brevipes]